MVVALEMQGATEPPPVTTAFSPSISGSWCTVQTWTVPGGVHSIEASALGGSGGQAYSAIANAYVGGGAGGTVSGSLNVNPGDVLDIYVAAGMCGYGTGGSSEGGGGGGSSAIVDTNTGQVLMVAGGGGGALSDPYIDGTGGWGYNGGDPNGGGAPANGATGSPWTCEGGGGATQSGPGDAGGSWWFGDPAIGWVPSYCGFPSGELGIYNLAGSAGSDPGSPGSGLGANYGDGGAGADLFDGNWSSYGGGGGAGYYGGGGGGAYQVSPPGGGPVYPYSSPGGGGSSWANPSYATNVSYGTGPAAPANGSVTITYTP